MAGLGWKVVADTSGLAAVSGVAKQRTIALKSVTRPWCARRHSLGRLRRLPPVRLAALLGTGRLVRDGDRLRVISLGSKGAFVELLDGRTGEQVRRGERRGR
jgi:hypothetical protein